jgi:hypothetical protein
MSALIAYRHQACRALAPWLRIARLAAIWIILIALWLMLAVAAPPVATVIMVVVFIGACLWNTPSDRSGE